MWNLLVIIPTTNIDPYLLCVYVGLDGIDWHLRAVNNEMLQVYFTVSGNVMNNEIVAVAELKLAHGTIQGLGWSGPKTG